MSSKDMQSKTIRSKIVSFSRKVARSLLPGVTPPNFSSRAYVVLVAVKAISDKHCIANTLQGKKCENEVSPKAVIQSIKLLYKLVHRPLLDLKIYANAQSSSITSDDDELREDLEQIAVNCICTNKNMNKPHHLQAKRIVEEWIAKANSLAMWESESFFK